MPKFCKKPFAYAKMPVMMMPMMMMPVMPMIPMPIMPYESKEVSLENSEVSEQYLSPPIFTDSRKPVS